MFRFIVAACLALFTFTAYAAGADDDDCIYNPAAFKDMLARLHHHHPGSRYTKDHDGVTIRQADGEVTVAYGGCENYGTEITFVSKKTAKYTQQAVFAKAVSLVRAFGQNRVDPRRLQILLKQGKFTRSEDAPGIIMVDYALMNEFTIELDQDAGQPATITVSFYN